MSFRQQAPAVKSIQSLSFTEVQATLMQPGPELYIAPSRPLGVVRLDLLWLDAGTIYQNHLYQARTALNLSLSGTATRSAEDIQEEFEHLGSSFGFNTTAFSGHMVLKASTQKFLPSLQWFLENFQAATYPDSELDSYKQIEIASLQRKMQTPRYWSNRVGMQQVFPEGHPMRAFSETHNIQDLKRHSLETYHKEILHPQHAIWVLTGETDSLSEKVIQKYLQPYFTEASKAPKQLSHAIRNMPPKGLVLHPVDHSSQVSMFLGKQIGTISETEMHRMSLLNMMLGGFFGSRLMQEIREERGLTYGIGSYISQSTEGNVWIVSGEMNSENALDALGATKEILESMYRNPPGGDELERAKKYYSGQLHSSFDGPFSISQKIQNLRQRGYTYNHYKTAMESIWETTAADLCLLADNFLRPETFHTVLAGDIRPNFE